MNGASVDTQTGIVKLPIEAPSQKSGTRTRTFLRETWTGRLDFLFSCIGFAVGFGNIWRFPYLCYISGGGAFLIPYIFFMITCSVPLFFLEVAIGQFASLGTIAVWRISPLFRGMGYGMIIIGLIVSVYYNVILAWNFYFLFTSMATELPWGLCGQRWNTPNCVAPQSSSNETQRTVRRPLVPASEEFWEHNVLEMTDGIDNFGTIRWPLFGCLLLAWVVVFLCLFKGIKSTGKIVYFTATFPYLVLVILLVRGVTLPGAGEGIKFYIIPKWIKLIDIKVWGDAAIQIFYSVGVSWGSIINMASYNKFNHDIYKDAIAVPVVNAITSVFAGFVTFSTLGFMSHESGLPIEEVVTHGPGLTFVAFPEAVARMPLGQLWAVMFFMMIFTVGLDTQMITSAIIEEYPDLLRQRKVLFTGVACFMAFLLGVPLVFQGGIYLLQLMDWYVATFSLMLFSIIECCVVCWVYDIDRFVVDIELMLGDRPNIWWLFMWKYFTPMSVVYIWAFSVDTLQPASMQSYKFPMWAICLGWAIGLVSIVPLPVSALIGIRRERTGTIWQRVKKLSQPAYSWAPALVENKIRYFKSMSKFDRERFEAAYFNMDRDRYLKARRDGSMEIGDNISIDPAFEVNDTILPVQVIHYFPVLSRLHECETLSD